MNFLSSRAVLRGLLSYPFVSLLLAMFSACEEPSPMLPRVKSYSVESIKIKKASTGVTSIDIPSNKPIIEIEFAGSVLKSSVNSTDFKLREIYPNSYPKPEADTIPLQVELSYKNRIITITPTKDLKQGTAYRFTTSNKIKSESGGVIGSKDVYVFNINTPSVAAAPARHTAPAFVSSTIHSINILIPSFTDFGANDQGVSYTAGDRILQQRKGFGIWDNRADLKLPDAGQEGQVTVNNLASDTVYYFRMVVLNANVILALKTTPGAVSAGMETASKSRAPGEHAAPSFVSSTTNSVLLTIPAFTDFGVNDQEVSYTTGSRVLWQREETDGSWTDRASVTLPDAGQEGQVTVDSLTAGTAYYFRIMVSNANTRTALKTTPGAVSVEMKTVSESRAPVEHAAPSFVSSTTDSIVLTVPAFTDFGANDQGVSYTAGSRTLQQREEASGSWTDRASVTLPDAGQGGRAIVDSLTANTAYYFRIVVSNANTDVAMKTTPGAVSVEMKTVSESRAPAEHAAPSFVSSTTDSIVLTVPAFTDFGANDQGVSYTAGSRTLQQREGAGGSWMDRASVTLPDAGQGGQAIVDGLTANTAYYFRIVVSNANTDVAMKTTPGAVSVEMKTAPGTATGSP